MGLWGFIYDLVGGCMGAVARMSVDMLKLATLLAFAVALFGVGDTPTQIGLLMIWALSIFIMWGYNIMFNRYGPLTQGLFLLFGLLRTVTVVQMNSDNFYTTNQEYWFVAMAGMGVLYLLNITYLLNPLYKKCQTKIKYGGYGLPDSIDWRHTLIGVRENDFVAQLEPNAPSSVWRFSCRACASCLKHSHAIDQNDHSDDGDGGGERVDVKDKYQNLNGGGGAITNPKAKKRCVAIRSLWDDKRVMVMDVLAFSLMVCFEVFRTMYLIQHNNQDFSVWVFNWANVGVMALLLLSLCLIKCRKEFAGGSRGALLFIAFMQVSCIFTDQDYYIYLIAPCVAAGGILLGLVLPVCMEKWKEGTLVYATFKNGKPVVESRRCEYLCQLVYYGGRSALGIFFHPMLLILILVSICFFIWTIAYDEAYTTTVTMQPSLTSLACSIVNATDTFIEPFFNFTKDPIVQKLFWPVQGNIDSIESQASLIINQSYPFANDICRGFNQTVTPAFSPPVFLGLSVYTVLIASIALMTTAEGVQFVYDNLVWRALQLTSLALLFLVYLIASAKSVLLKDVGNGTSVTNYTSTGMIGAYLLFTTVVICAFMMIRMQLRNMDREDGGEEDNEVLGVVMQPLQPMGANKGKPDGFAQPLMGAKPKNNNIKAFQLKDEQWDELVIGMITDVVIKAVVYIVILIVILMYLKQPIDSFTVTKIELEGIPPWSIVNSSPLHKLGNALDSLIIKAVGLPQAWIGELGAYMFFNTVPLDGCVDFCDWTWFPFFYPAPTCQPASVIKANNFTSFSLGLNTSICPYPHLGCDKLVYNVTTQVFTNVLGFNPVKFVEDFLPYGCGNGRLGAPGSNTVGTLTADTGAIFKALLPLAKKIVGSLISSIFSIARRRRLLSATDDLDMLEAILNFNDTSQSINLGPNSAFVRPQRRLLNVYGGIKSMCGIFLGVINDLAGTNVHSKICLSDLLSIFPKLNITSIFYTLANLLEPVVLGLIAELPHPNPLSVWSAAIPQLSFINLYLNLGVFDFDLSQTLYQPDLSYLYWLPAIAFIILLLQLSTMYFDKRSVARLAIQEANMIALQGMVSLVGGLGGLFLTIPQLFYDLGYSPHMKFNSNILLFLLFAIVLMLFGKHIAYCVELLEASLYKDHLNPTRGQRKREGMYQSQVDQVDVNEKDELLTASVKGQNFTDMHMIPDEQ